MKTAGGLGMIITLLIIAALFVYVRNNWNKQQA
jgi:hypothetical protein